MIKYVCQMNQSPSWKVPKALFWHPINSASHS